MTRQATQDDSSESEELERRKLDPIKVAARAIKLAKETAEASRHQGEDTRQLRESLEALKRQYDLVVHVLASRGVLLTGPERQDNPKEKPERRPVGPRTAGCPAAIIVTIHSAGRPCTLDDLTAALEDRYSRRTIAEYAAKMKAAGELANDGFGYSIPID